MKEVGMQPVFQGERGLGQKARRRFASWARNEKGRLEADLFENRWCPGEDSVTRARPRLRLQAQPFE
ncbi:hypothetical protein, partial [Burkholderia ubonensis]|uniref:hypothetical protein n=1 Tax=Burkholderia ubonensis TaxID=101571 RepID=UPI001E41D022